MNANVESPASTTTHAFQAEVPRLLDILSRSMYSNKEIFLRELISNAADALEKLNYEALSDSALLEGSDEALSIWLSFDKDARTITLRDNGIGMSEVEIKQNLGTLAKSGTREFLAKMEKSQQSDAQMIGQFGVGFYSAFVVADRVDVYSRRAGLSAEEGVFWSSDGGGEYQLAKRLLPNRGTELVLHLRDGEDEFLDQWRLRNIVVSYSDHISVPVLMQEEKQAEATEEDEDSTAEDKAPTLEWKTVNQAKALWTQAKSEITEEQYQEFYKHIAHDFENPLAWAHNRVEGKLDYTSLLYLPKRAPFDLMSREHQRGLKLYVQRVFIMDKAEAFLPSYLRFVKGVIDSKDLPLNVSRELLQSNKVIETIRSGCVKRVLGLLESMAEDQPDDYAAFWSAFGQVIKEGPGEDFANKDRIAKLLRFSSTTTEDDQQTVSLADYVSRMQPEQDKIYYVTADTHIAAKNSPHIEVFRKKGIEVLLLSDRVDEWLVSHLTEFEGKTLQSVAKGGVDLEKMADDEEKEAHQSAEEQFSSVVKQAQEVLKDKVKEVRLTFRLTDSAACLVSEEGDMSGHLKRILQEAGQNFGGMAGGTLPILELNPEHPLVSGLKAEQDDDRFSDWTNTLFDQALLAEGGHLEDPATYVRRLNKLIAQQLTSA